MTLHFSIRSQRFGALVRDEGLGLPKLPHSTLRRVGQAFLEEKAQETPALSLKRTEG